MTPQELLEKVQKDHANVVDLIPLITELTYEATNEIGTYDRIVWDSPSGRRYLNFKETSRRKFIKDMKGSDRYFIDVCDPSMRYANMEFLLDKYSYDHSHVLIRCRDNSHGLPEDIPEDLTVRAVMNSGDPQFDNPEFVQAMMGPLEDHDVEIMEPKIDDDQLQVRIFFPESDNLSTNQWIFRPGMMMINSETGKYKPTIECILWNRSNSSIIRWPVDNGPILEINRREIQKADFTKQLETVPGTAYEQIDHMKKALVRRTTETFDGDVTLQLYLMLRGAKINDDGRYLQEMISHIGHYTNQGKRAITKMDMVQAVARVASQHSQMRFARLAGAMMANDSVWSNNLAAMVQRAQKKANQATVTA